MTTPQPDPPLAPDELVSTGGEREVLEAFLDLYREVLKRKLGGLSDEQIRQRRVPSQTTLGGLIKHLTAVEREWFQVILAGRTEEELGDAPSDDDWTLSTGESASDLIAGYERACAASRREASGFALEDAVPHPRMGRVSLRWIYVHMIEESARHVGHADILREQTDGATGFDGLRLPRDPPRHGMVAATYPIYGTGGTCTQAGNQPGGTDVCASRLLKGPRVADINERSRGPRYPYPRQ